MTDRVLTDLLERTANRTQVGPPPLDAIVARTARVRRRRRTLLVTAAASVAAILTAGGAAVLSTTHDDSQQDPAPGHSPSPPSTTDGGARTDLQGTWTVRVLVGENGQTVFRDDRSHHVHLTFNDGRVTGSTGCNDVFGTYEQSGNGGRDLTFPRRQLGSTLAGCSDEPPLVSRLLDVRHVSGRGSTRYLHAGNWMIVAELRPTPMAGECP